MVCPLFFCDFENLCKCVNIILQRKKKTGATHGTGQYILDKLL